MAPYEDRCTDSQHQTERTDDAIVPTVKPTSGFNPIKLRGSGEPASIIRLRDRGYGSEHPDIAEWEASQNASN